MIEANTGFSKFKSSFRIAFEVLFVITLGFGIFIYASTVSFISSLNNEAIAQTYDSFDFIFIVVYEVIILVVLSYFLKSRQWSINDFNLDFRITMIAVAFGLIFVRETTGFLLNLLMENIQVIGSVKELQPNILFSSNLISMAVIVIVNSIYEELLLTGYLFKRLEHFHPAIVIAFSFIIRASYHSYQGLTNLPIVFVLAMVFGLYYMRYKKLWPVIIAHGIGNIFHFLNSHYHWLNI
jgi:membrane protease YdiL (CAAX protease family)